MFSWLSIHSEDSWTIHFPTRARAQVRLPAAARGSDAYTATEDGGRYASRRHSASDTEEERRRQRSNCSHCSDCKPARTQRSRRAEAAPRAGRARRRAPRSARRRMLDAAVDSAADRRSRSCFYSCCSSSVVISQLYQQFSVGFVQKVLLLLSGVFLRTGFCLRSSSSSPHLLFCCPLGGCKSTTLQKNTSSSVIRMFRENL